MRELDNSPFVDLNNLSVVATHPKVHSNVRALAAQEAVRFIETALDWGRSDFLDNDQVETWIRECGLYHDDDQGPILM